MKKIFILLFLLSAFSAHIFAHSGKPKYSVIIDTDGAIDDMRAISMLLSGNDIRVLAITCSQGTLLPDSIAVKVKSLLHTYHNEGIPVGTGANTDFELPVWASFANGIKWGESSGEFQQSVEAVSLLNGVTQGYNNKVILIALGSLKTYADWIRQNPAAIDKVERIIWYNNHKISKGFNYKACPESYDFIKGCGIALEIVSAESNDMPVTQNYLNELKECPSYTAQHIVEVHQQGAVTARIERNHLKMWDDFIPLYLISPYQFKIQDKDGCRYVSMDKKVSESDINKSISNMLLSVMRPTNQVFTTFPIDDRLYRPAYANMINQTIEKYGAIEWKAIVMTNEIHGHVGIYSMIGAKMGIRAMEYFNVGVNNMIVTTFSGHKPPKSCFNDGIQISTGCTIGQGLITIADSISDIPSAIFEFNHQKIHVSLKKEIATRIKKDIKHGVKTYGLKSDEYWLYVERLAIDYWTQYDRQNIFDINVIAE